MTSSKPRVDLAGRRFGHLVVTADAGIALRNGVPARQWSCRCDCGQTKLCWHARLQAGKLTTCGCFMDRGCKIAGSKHYAWRGQGGIPAHTWAGILVNARRRQIEVTISCEFAGQLLEKQGCKCALSGLPIQLAARARSVGTASLDRIDSGGHYTEDNVQWVHKDVNMMKRSLTSAEFVAICRAVAAHHPLSPTGELPP